MDSFLTSPVSLLRHKHRLSNQTPFSPLPSRDPPALEYPKTLPYKANYLRDLREGRTMTMRSSESQPNLASMADLSIEDRERLAVPASTKRNLSSGPVSRRITMTPPQLLPADPAMYDDKARMSSKKSIFSSMRDNDDDVFGGAEIRPRSRLSSSHKPTDAPTSSEKPAPTEHLPRVDRLGVKVTSENAQDFLNPHHVVFVANLVTDTADKELEQKCHNLFKKWGECYVKIRRDQNGHPFGYIQYHNADAAKAGLEGGNGVELDGRSIRTEEAEVNRSVILTQRGGGPVTQEDAHELLSPYGSIEEIVPATNYDSATYNLGEGMRVTFAFYGDYVDAKKQFNKCNPAYRVYPAPRHNQQGSKFGHGRFSDRSGPVMSNPRSLTDQRSLFVGNLPHQVQESELREIFDKSGKIVSCNIIRKPIAGGSGQNVFAFIEYDTIPQARRALETHTAVDIHGQRVRVEGKEYSSRAPGRNHYYNQQPEPYRTPRGRDWGSPRNMYQPPHMMSPGYYPYMSSPYGPYPPVHPSMYGYSPTPPTSAHRQGVQLGYMVPGSPTQGAQFIPVNYNGPEVMPTATDPPSNAPVGPDPSRHQQKRWR